MGTEKPICGSPKTKVTYYYMLLILHGYVLEGSGSNLWTKTVLEILCQQVDQIHLYCQESHPENYPFIAQAYVYPLSGGREKILDRKSPYPGHVVCHRAEIGDEIPVYVGRHYPGFRAAIPMNELNNSQIKSYTTHNMKALERVIQHHAISFVHVNHLVLLSHAAKQVCQKHSIPFGIMPHGSALEYIVKKDQRYLDLSTTVLQDATCVFSVNSEMDARLQTTFSHIKVLKSKFERLGIGVDSFQFQPLPPNRRAKHLDRMKQWIGGLKTHSEVPKKFPIKAFPSTRADYADFLQQHYPSVKTVESPFATSFSKDWDKAPTLLCVGKLISAKGIQNLVLSLPYIFEKKPKINCLIVGNGPLRGVLESIIFALATADGKLLQRILEWGSPNEDENGQKYFQGAQDFIKHLIKTNSLPSYLESCRHHFNAKRIEFVGYLPHEILALLYPLCDVTVCPSQVKEAGPMVFLEALSSGSFPIGTYQGGMTYFIDTIEKKMGTEMAEIMKLPTHSIESIQSLPQKILWATKHLPNLRPRLHELAAECFDWRTITEQLLKHV